MKRAALARLVTDVLAPGYVLIGLLLIIGEHSTGTVGGLGWGLVAALLGGAFPLAVVLVGVRRRWWTDVHIGVREQRFVPVAVALAANLAGVGLLLAARAPRELIALVAAVAAGLAAGAVITARWKVSGHTAVAGAAATALTVAYGPALLATFLAVPLIGWSRVALGDHTIGQTVAGLVLGVAAIVAVFVPLR
jgi:membrane-associated phospholipid phosphatase